MADETPFRTIIYEKDGPVATITLNRPRVLNAYSVQMRDDLWEVLSAIRRDAEVRAVIVNGSGRSFCAGADLTEFLTAPSPPAARDIRRQRDVWRLFLGLRQPVIAALHGYTIGSGIEIALCCDIRLASEDARFSLPETGLGFIPGAGATQLLPRTVGRAASLRMVLTGAWLNAAEAEAIGLVNRVLPAATLFSAAVDLADRLASLPPRVTSGAKEAVTRGLDMPLREGLALERRLAQANNRVPN